jgi:acetyl-CoA C-acetyltransferase
MKDIYVLGGYQTDFSRNYTREGIDLAGLIKEAAEGGLAACKLEGSDIDVAHIGNFVGELFARQAHLGGLLAEVVPGLRNKPINRHEAACASGSVATMAAIADLAAGFHETALVLGVELMRNVPGGQAGEFLAPAAWTGHEAQTAKFVWPSQFSDLIDEYDRRYGIDHKHLHAISENNFANARRNQNSQTRGWEFPEGSFSSDDQLNPIVEGRIRRTDCSQVTDGAASIVIATQAAAQRYAERTGQSLEQIPRLKGWSYRVARMPLAEKVADSKDQSLIFPHVAQVTEEARKMAGIHDVFDLSGVETHDCFSISEYMAIDHLGITAPGESWKAVEDGTIKLGGRLPINASGGLIGVGHPVGATGIRMILDGVKQVTGQAGDYQIEGASNIQTLNIGGSTTTTASFVVGL